MGCNVYITGSPGTQQAAQQQQQQAAATGTGTDETLIWLTALGILAATLLGSKK